MASLVCESARACAAAAGSAGVEAAVGGRVWSVEVAAAGDVVAGAEAAGAAAGALCALSEIQPMAELSNQAATG